MTRGVRHSPSQADEETSGHGWDALLRSTSTYEQKHLLHHRSYCRYHHRSQGARRVLDPRPVLAASVARDDGIPLAEVADGVAEEAPRGLDVSLDRERSLTLLFDPEHALDERIAMEQFTT